MALKKIRQIVETCGVEQARAWLQETHTIEASGGLMINNGERRRTPGGVFFYLVKGRISKELRKQLFPFPSKKRKKKRLENSAIQEAPAQNNDANIDTLDRLEELRQAEQETLERLSAIQTLPPLERTGLMSVMKDLLKIRDEIRSFEG